MGLIYQIRNIVNNKIYIGQTSKSLEVRKKSHLKDMKRAAYKSYLYNAFNTYGLDSFEWTVLEADIELELLLIKESYYIDKLNSLSPNGYNLRTHNGTKSKMCVETRDKLRKSQLGKLASIQTKMTMSENRRKRYADKTWSVYDRNGMNNPNIDTTIYKFSNDKLSTTFIGNRLEFSNNFNIKLSLISQVICGRNKTTYGWSILKTN